MKKPKTLTELFPETMEALNEICDIAKKWREESDRKLLVYENLEKNYNRQN